MKKKISIYVVLLMTFCLLFSQIAVASSQTDDLKQHVTYFDQVPVILLGDSDSGEILYRKNTDKPYPIASMSKLMTFYVVKKAIQSGEINENDEVLINKEAADLNIAEYSNYGLKIGEKVTVKKLLEGLMVVSGNDAAQALATKVAGSKQKFADRMNQMAKSLGFTKSHFINPHGLSENNKNNVMTAEELFRLANLILKDFPEVKEYSKMDKLVVPERNFNEPSTLADNDLSKIKGITGLKTGSTPEAGYCFTGTFNMKKINENLNYNLVTIVIGAPTPEARWRTTKELVDYSAGTFIYNKIIDENRIITYYDLPNSKEGSVAVYPAKSLPMLSYQDSQFTVKYEFKDGVKAPTKKGEELGKAVVYQNEKKIDTIPLIAKQETHKKNFFEKFIHLFDEFFQFIGALLN